MLTCLIALALFFVTNAQYTTTEPLKTRCQPFAAISSQNTLAWECLLQTGLQGDYLGPQDTACVNQVNFYLHCRSKTEGPASHSNSWTQLAEEATCFERKKKKLSHTWHVRSGPHTHRKKKLSLLQTCSWMQHNSKHNTACFNFILQATLYTIYNSHWANFNSFFHFFFFCFLSSRETAFTGPNLRVTIHSTPPPSQLCTCRIAWHATLHHTTPTQLLTTTLLEFYYIQGHTFCGNKEKTPAFNTGGVHDLTHGRYHEGRRTDATTQASRVLKNHQKSHTHRLREPLSPLTSLQTLSGTPVLLCAQRTVHTFALHKTEQLCFTRFRKAENQTRQRSVPQ